ncbi:superoxide-generating nadph oxidase heavy chain subunit b [Hordeum vulgare]|nr:superoxide-generating nadph oxidase heavy chain subunit b [Hordeum vulgare]
MGHWHQECGSGEFEEEKLEWGPFILAPRRGRGNGRGAGQQRDGGRGRGDLPNHPEFGRGRGGFGRGDGDRGTMARFNGAANEDFDPAQQSWRWNSNTHINPDENQKNANLLDIAPSAKKRLAMGSGPDDTCNLSMVATDKTSFVVQRVDQLEKGQDTKNDPKVTPQKNKNKKKLKAENGVAIDSIDIRMKGTDGDTYESAANSAQGMDEESTIQNIEDRSGATGVVLRDSQGVFVAASSIFIPHVASASMAEALGMLHGLQFANNLGYNRIQAESDNLKVTELCTGEKRIWNEATAVVPLGTGKVFNEAAC